MQCSAALEGKTAKLTPQPKVTQHLKFGSFISEIEQQARCCVGLKRVGGGKGRRNWNGATSETLSFGNSHSQKYLSNGELLSRA